MSFRPALVDPQGWSHNWQRGWSHITGKTSAQLVPCGWQTTQKDNAVPWVIANASFKLQKRNKSTTEIQEIPGRGHSLVIDSGWSEVAAAALNFIKGTTP